MNRRAALRLGGLAAAGSLAGCAALSSAPPDVETNTGLDGDPSAGLEGEPVFLAGETRNLPEPPTTADALADAEVALATPGASTAPLAEAFREGTAVAFAGGGSQEALAALLEAVRGAYDYGIETVKGRPVGVSVAEPRGDTADTFQLLREGGWADPVLDPLGWALDARIPDCETFVPESSADELYVPAGSAWIAGRLESGETYAARTRATKHTGDTRRLRLRTAMHAAANGGYPVAEAHRVADFPNDEGLLNWFPNPHERNGVEVSNHSSPIEERLDVSFSPADDAARGALTGCCGLMTGGEYAYDHRMRWIWTDDGLLGSESRYGGGLGRGEWHVRD